MYKKYVENFTCKSKIAKTHQKNKDNINVMSKKSRKKSKACCTIAIYQKVIAIFQKRKRIEKDLQYEPDYV